MADINEELISTYKAVRNNPAGVTRILRRYAVTAEAYYRVRRSEPKSSDAHAQLGDLFLQINNVEGARRETASSLALDPQNYAANRTLMRLYRLDSDPRLAAQTERLKTLVEENDANRRMLQRTIEVRPW